MIIDEVKYNIFWIDGLHLDNCQICLYIMELNIYEIYKIDNDGQPTYSVREIFNEEISIPNSVSDYWECESCELYTNPILIILVTIFKCIIQPLLEENK